VHEYSIILLKLLCLALGVLMATQVYGMMSERDPLQDLEASSAAPLLKPAESSGGPEEPETPAKPAAGKPPAVTLPECYGPITAKGIFGVMPPRPPIPILLEGIGSDYAFIRSARGRSGLVKAGDTFDGIKLIRIGQNRVLIEIKGKQKELIMYGGLGGESLVPRGKKPPEKTDTQEKKK